MINYDEVLNKNVRNIPPSGIRKYFDLAEKMDDVISLGVGEPDFCTVVDKRGGYLFARKRAHVLYCKFRSGGIKRRTCKIL